jgi:hypothetical protein
MLDVLMAALDPESDFEVANKEQEKLAETFEDAAFLSKSFISLAPLS